MLAAVEMRLYPFFVSRFMHNFGLYAGSNEMIMVRFGLFRTQLTLCHPIDVGNVAFPCGYTLGPDGDAINLYYGAADTSVALATGSVRELLSWLDKHAGGSDCI